MTQNWSASMYRLYTPARRAFMLLMLGFCSSAHGLTVTVGSDPSCDFPDPVTALAANAAVTPLEMLLQGRPAAQSTITGVYRQPLRIGSNRVVRVKGVASCEDHGRPEHRPLLTRPPSGLVERLIVVSGESLFRLRHVDVVDTERGGVLVNGRSRFEVRDATFSGHRTTAGVSGTAISIDDAYVELEQVVFTDNESPAAGGAIFCAGSQTGEASIIEIEEGHTSFGLPGFGRGNRAGTDGGAIMLFRNCELTRSFADTIRFENNSAGRDGGAIALAQTSASPAQRNRLMLGTAERTEGDFLGTTFVDNFAARDGGALHIGFQGEGASARLVGVIAADNAGGITAPPAALSHTCSSIPLEGLSPPDPGFVPPPGTERGLFRLDEGSPMRNFCEQTEVESQLLPIGHDLDGVARRVTKVGDVDFIDAGAFGHVDPLPSGDAVFSSGFE